MEFEGITYRPPMEIDVPLLQVTVGCAHNSCSFCNMYRDVQFRVVGMDQIESDLKEINFIFPQVKRIFLVNGDAFVLSASKLKKIAQRIIDIFPQIETITMYASIKNIQTKTDLELKELFELRINDLYIGVESGIPDVVKSINKGYQFEDAKFQLNRLTSAGINHISNIMLGIAGGGRGKENAQMSAKFLNETKPKSVWIGTTTIYEDTPLFDQIKSGTFEPATELEILEEEKTFISQLQLNGIRIYGDHPSNSVKVTGYLPADRQKVIDKIDRGIEEWGVDKLNQVLDRSTLPGMKNL